MRTQHLCLTGNALYTVYPSTTTGMSSSLLKYLSGIIAALLWAATRYVASSVVTSHTYPFLPFILKDDSSNWTNEASEMRFRISRHVGMGRFLKVLRALHTALGDVLNPYRASK